MCNLEFNSMDNIQEIGKKMELILEEENLFYIKNGGKVSTKNALNIFQLTPKAIEHLDYAINILKDSIIHVLPTLYKSKIIDEIFPEFNRYFSDINKNCEEMPSNIGLDCSFNPDVLSLKLFEINFNAVVSLGYIDPLIKSYINFFSQSLPNGSFRPLGPLLLNELRITPNKKVYILGSKNAKTYHEELNQVSILKKCCGADIKRITLENLDDIEESDFCNSPNKSIIIKRAISGSIIAQFGSEWNLLKNLEKKGFLISNPLIGLGYGSKVSLFLLKLESNYPIIKEILGEEKAKFLDKIIPRTDVSINGKVYTIEGNIITVDEYLLHNPMNKLVFKNNLGGGDNSNVIFGPKLNLKEKRNLFQKLKVTKEAVVIQPYLRGGMDYYNINRGSHYKPTRLKNMFRIYMQPCRNTWTAQLCVGPGPNVSFSNYAVPVYFRKN